MCCSMHKGGELEGGGGWWAVPVQYIAVAGGVIQVLVIVRFFKSTMASKQTQTSVFLFSLDPDSDINTD